MTIEELRRARLAAKQEAMGGIGGYAEAKRKTQAEAEVEESPFFDPPVEIEPARSTLDPPPADEPKEEVIHPRTKADKPKEEIIATAPPAPAPRKAKSHKVCFCATKRLAPGAFTLRRFGSKVAT